jgi:hypothetical protein
MMAVEQERLRIAEIAATTPKRPPKPLWLKLLPVVFLVIGILGRIYYIRRLASEGPANIPSAGQETKQAGEEGYKALGGR